MPLKIPHNSVVVHRNGKNIWPRRGQPFDFTPAEIEFIESHNEFALRDPVNEGVAMTETELLSGARIPEDADATADASLLALAPAKAGGDARNQGGSLEEGNHKPPAKPGKKAAVVRAATDDDDEL